MASEFWPIITALGDIRFWLLVLLFLGAYIVLEKPRLSRHTKHALLIILITFVVVSLAAQAVKMVVNEPRICTPCPADGCNPYCPTDDPYGFPSGHAALSFGMFTAAWLAFPRNNMTRIKWVAAVVVLATLVSVSRIALGVHTPEQVLVGATIGIAGALIVWHLLKDRM